MLSPDENPDQEADRRLQALFGAYREACPEAEPGADFMPQLWKRIEARRSFRYRLSRMARGIITAAVAAVLLMGVFLARPPAHPTPSYLELLAAGQSRDNLADTEMVMALHENAR